MAELKVQAGPRNTARAAPGAAEGAAAPPPRLKAPLGEPVPTWDPARMDERACIACGGTGRTVVCHRPDGLEVARCDACAAVYLPRIPDAGQLAEYYSSYSTTKPYMQDHRPPPAASAGAKLRRLGRRVFRRDILLAASRRLVPALRPILVSETAEVLLRTGGLKGQRVCELGPGPTGGVLPEVAVWGGRGVAVEVDAIAAAAVRRLGFDVHADVSSLPEPADVFYVSMVLEHVADPRGLLRDLAARTAPQGRILVRVPNAGQAHAVGPHWVGFRLDLEHLNYFDTPSLCRMLAAAGYETECVWLTAQPLMPVYLPTAYRPQFLSWARDASGRDVVATGNDPLGIHGEFVLSVLARFEGGRE